jgi:hypothetical protein
MPWHPRLVDHATPSDIDQHLAAYEEVLLQMHARRVELGGVPRGKSKRMR